jgi:transposase
VRRHALVLTVIWHMLSTGKTYRDIGGDYYRRRGTERQIRRLVTRLHAIGHTVTPQKTAA